MIAMSLWPIPRKTSLDRFARVRLRIRPYSESDLILGIMKIILDLDLWDGKFVRDQTVNFLPMKNLLDKISLKGILKRTGVSSEALEEAARVLGKAPKASIIFGGDVILQENGLQCAMNLANLALLTGNVGGAEPGCSLFLRKGTCSECVAWERFRNTFPDSRTLCTRGTFAACLENQPSIRKRENGA